MPGLSGEPAAVWGTPSVAVPGPVKGHFLPRSNPRSLLLFAQRAPRPSPRSPPHLPPTILSAAAPAAGKSGPGRISSADLRLPEPSAPPDSAGPRTARAAARGPASLPLGCLSDPSPSALSPLPLLLAPSQPVFQRKADASLPRGFLINRVLQGSVGRALGPRGLAEGGRGGAGEVFKLELEPPPRGPGSRGAVERPCASSGRDPGVWRGVGPWGRFAQNVRWLRGRGAAAALSQVGAAQRRGWPAP